MRVDISFTGIEHLKYKESDRIEALQKELHKLNTELVEDGDAYILNGAKMWITNSPVADIAVVWAKNENGSITTTSLAMVTISISVNKIVNIYPVHVISTGITD